MQRPGGFGRRTVVVSSCPSAANTCGARIPAAPASERVVRNWRRVCIVMWASPLFLMGGERQSDRGQAEGCFSADRELFNMPGLAIVRCLEMDVDVAVAGCKHTAMPGRIKTDDRCFGLH